jgi:WD40 repeat protein
VGIPAFSSDGKRIVTPSADGTVRLWDAQTGKPIGEPFAGHGVVMSAVFSPDGKRIVTAGFDGTRLWNAETGKQIGEPLKGHENWVWRAAFSPDGKRIVTASWDKTARVWDVETGQQIGEPLKDHSGAVWSAAFSPDGKRIVTSSEDKTVRVWDAETDKQIGERTAFSAASSTPLQIEKNGFNAAFSPDGKLILSLSENAQLSKVFANAQELILHAKEAVVCTENQILQYW